jgi:2-polyprenyl-3-methyl-5-hydroxy-6-metoxy-1,4-benzoquinol methylase
MDLQAIRFGWDQAAREDPMFNIVSDPTKVGSGWTREEFFEHGRAEIGEALAHLDDLELNYASNHALDFGCGIGRLTQALAEYFSEVDGTDISWEMIGIAESLNECDWVRYYTNGDDLAIFGDDRFDLVYSMITLQHMPREYQRTYVREFFRVLKPGGVAMVHMPEGPDDGHEHRRMYGVKQLMAESWIRNAGGRLVDVEDLGMDAQWRNYRYTAVAT